MSIATSVYAEYVFGGPTPDTDHSTILSALRAITEQDDDKPIYFPEISILYRFDDGSAIVVDGKGISDHDTIDEAAEAIARREK
ncbi:MAG: hypothetical protein F4Y39_21205 [Gemmatimonadetes bacterium]|nr:hypothetical protein [Gemmatimonadota bacterium]MYF79397.1 hypothetical protein [Chloroflexota bacterium]